MSFPCIISPVYFIKDVFSLVCNLPDPGQIQAIIEYPESRKQMLRLPGIIGRIALTIIRKM